MLSVSAKKTFFLTLTAVLLVVGLVVFILPKNQTDTIQSGDLKTSFSKADNSVNMDIKVGVGQAGIETPLSNVQTVLENKESGEYNFKSRTDGTEVRYKKIEKGIKEEIILSTPPVSNIFTVKMELEGLTPKTNDQGLVVFYDANNNYQFHFDKPFVIDASGIKTEDLHYQMRRRLGEETDDKITKYNVILEINKDWLSDPKRVYPVTIDPTVISDQEEASIIPSSNQVWQEMPNKRNQTSKTYRNTENPAKYSWDGTLATIHYESVPDSGNYDTPIDMTPVRVNDSKSSGLNGWQITQNGWHYRLGTPKDKGGEDGWVGFGGRNGEKWFNFRLAQVGYLDWNNKSFNDVGGAINYNRKNLSAELYSLPFGPNNEQLPIESVLFWNDLWTTPVEGTIGIRWRVSGNELKEEIIIDQKAREYIKVNKSLKGKEDGTYFGFVFEIDWDGIPKVIRNGALKSKSANLDLIDDGKKIEFKDEMDRLLAFMPISDAWVNDENGLEIKDSRVELKKRFYKQGNDTYLVVGLSAETLDSLPDGNLVIDPTLDYQAGADTDDGFRYTGGDGFVGSTPAMPIGYQTSWHYYTSESFVRFTGVSGLSGATINDGTYFSTYRTGGSGTPLTKIRANDAASPVAPTTTAEFNALTLTTEGVDWDGLPGSVWQYNHSPELKSVIQELATSYDPTAIQIMHMDDGTSHASGNIQTYGSYLWAGGQPKLHIEYTASGPAPTPTPAPGTRMTGLKMSKLCVGSAPCPTVVPTPVPWACGDTLTINHTTAGGVAPVNKSVTYGTVSTSIAGTGSKCWITQNLGAADQASSTTDNDEDSAGWYWQFNRKQGYQYTTSRTPSAAWDTSNDSTYAGWDPAKNPCTLELGAGWRLPTYNEWVNADGSPQNWANHEDVFNSVLKIHDAGYINKDSGSLENRGSAGRYWASTQNDDAGSQVLRFQSDWSNVLPEYKSFGFSIRCLKD